MFLPAHFSESQEEPMATEFVRQRPIITGFSGSGIAGFQMGNGTLVPFITPEGYKPMGPVSVWCIGPMYIAARGW